MSNFPNIDELLSRKEPLDAELQPYIEKDKIWTILRHPLVFGVPYMEPMNAFYNAQLKAKKERIKECLENKAWSSFFFMHERPYRLSKFLEVRHLMSDEEYWSNLGSLWSDSENIWQFEKILPTLLAKQTGRDFFMNEEEKKFLNNLPDQFIIYRGHQKRNKKGYSWTLSYWTANWFAQRFNHKNWGVAEAIVNKKDIIGVLLGRNEYEVVVSPDHLKIKNSKKINRCDWIEEIFQKAKTKFRLKQSCHGVWHWEKVEKNALILAKKTGADKLVCQLFALIHDSHRENDDDDPEHGLRASKWAEELFEAGCLKINQDQLKKLVEACKYHNDGRTSQDPTIGVCWDADRLDLPRVGINPEARYFSTEAAKELIWKV